MQINLENLSIILSRDIVTQNLEKTKLHKLQKLHRKTIMAIENNVSNNVLNVSITISKSQKKTCNYISNYCNL